HEGGQGERRKAQRCRVRNGRSRIVGGLVGGRVGNLCGHSSSLYVGLFCHPKLRCGQTWNDVANPRGIPCRRGVREAFTRVSLLTFVLFGRFVSGVLRHCTTFATVRGGNRHTAAPQ